MSITTHTNWSTGSYLSDREAFIKARENPQLSLDGVTGLTPYNDGSIAIGYGFDILVNSVSDVSTYITEVGGTFTQEANTLLTAYHLDKTQGLVDSAYIIDLVNNLNGHISLPSEQAATTLFNNIANNKFETAISKSVLPESKERIAILSYMYNFGVNGIPTTMSLLNSGGNDPAQRVKIWYEMRYNSGVVNTRRQMESDLFGLFDTEDGLFSNDDLEAKITLSFLFEDAVQQQISSKSAISDFNTQIDTAKVYLESKYAFGNTVDRVIHDTYNQDILSGSDGADLIFGDTGNDHLYGKSGNDVLYGEAGLDVLEGGAGDDHLNGGSGHDIYVINAGEGTDHIVDSGANTIVVNGTPVTHLISDDAGGYILKGTTITATHNSSLTITDSSGAGASVVIDNWQDGDFGIKLMDIPATTTTQAITLPGYHSTTLDTEDGSALIDGNTVEGGNGTVQLGIMIGSTGNWDAYQTATPVDAVYAGGGNDIVNVMDIAHNPGINVYGGSGNDYVGFAQDTAAAGTEGAYLYGEDGNDSLGGSNMDDWLEGGLDHDILRSKGGKDTLLGDSGNDMLFGGDDQDDLFGGEDDDYVFGGAGADQLFGGRGNDKLYGDTEKGTVSVPWGDGEAQTFTYWDGQHIIRYPISMWLLPPEQTLLELHTVQDVGVAEVGNDLLSGGDGEDLIFGGGGDDQIYGGNDKDHLYGEGVMIFDRLAV